MMSVDGENSFLRHHIPITTPLVIRHREDLDIVHGLKPNVMNVATMSLQTAHHLIEMTVDKTSNFNRVFFKEDELKETQSASPLGQRVVND